VEKRRRLMSLSPLFHQMPPQMRPRHAHLDSPCRPIRGNHERLSSTSRMFVGRMEAKIGRQPPQIACLPEHRAPKHRGLPSPRPGWFIAQGLLSATPPKLLRRFFGSILRVVPPAMTPSEHIVAVALRNTLPESLATAAKTSIQVLISFALIRVHPWLIL
jgi:hypothetical protein